MSYIRPAIITIALTAYHKIVSLSRYIFVDDEYAFAGSVMDFAKLTPSPAANTIQTY